MGNNKKIKLLIVSHRPFKIPKGEIFVPIHAGRAIACCKTKDGCINKKDLDWLITNTIGDETGNNISIKNRMYCECSALYWAWKNYDKLENPDYIGLMHYRRHFIFNEEFYNNYDKSKWEDALAYIEVPFIDNNYQSMIGLNDNNIITDCSKYDLIVTKDAKLNLIHNRNIRQDYIETIPGVKVKDFDLMLNLVKEKYPKIYNCSKEKIKGYNKSLYQMFIMKKEYFFEYCNFLFDILGEIEKVEDFSSYSVNGKRTLGYLAENLLSMFVWTKEQEKAKILKLGVTLVDYPYEISEIKNLLEKKPPSYFEYLIYKIYYLLSDKSKKQIIKEKYTKIKNERKSYKKLKKVIHQYK